jgi:acetyl-CoA synthetase
MSASDGSPLDDLLREDRRFPPPASFRDQALVSDPSVYAEAEADPEGWWARWASELTWFEPWHTVRSGTHPESRWFEGGKLNVAWNCLDRHVANGAKRNQAAILWEGEPGDTRTLTYFELHREVGRLANGLRSLGIGKGDRVAIYLPMIPEAAIAMLACARIGAIHSVVFGGFSPESLADRIRDAGARLLITADGGFRRGSPVPLKRNADEAVRETPTIEHVVVVARGWDMTRQTQATMTPGRDIWYHDLVRGQSGDAPAESMDSEDVLFILYTSGTTGKPKGVVHSTGGYLTQVQATTRWVFDLKDDDVYWCTADVGWVTGHSYIVYGPLACGATLLMYEGAPDFPDRGRFWELCEKWGVTIFYTAPTAIRAFMKWGASWPETYDLSRLRLLGSVGEPINPEAWVWYHTVIGGGRCPIVDTWWQTETGAILISPLPGITETTPGSATLPFPGVSATILDGDGEERNAGFLAIPRPWPSMLRTIWGDHARFLETYGSKWPGVYFPGDGAKRDADGFLWILGRVDDVLNVAGHRIGTMEVESALVDHPAVAEAAVVGRPHELKGQAIAAFVTLREGNAPTTDLAESLKQHVGRKIGAIARPDDILFSADLPKTRSGKIMRRLLRDIAEGKAIGDTTTLADPEVVARLKERYEAEGG